MKCLMRAMMLAAVLAFAAPTSQAQLFVTSLSGPNESPPNASTGTGSAVVTLDSIANTMRVQVNFTGLTTGDTASHIHAATAVPGAGTAGVATTTPTFTGFPSGVTSGSYDNTFDMTLSSSYNPAYVTANGGTPASAETALFSAIGAGKAYLNIHSSTFPGGEIRGFLISATPEPGTLGLLGGLAVCGTLLAARRRRRPYQPFA
jgi:hypothetical protein